MRQWFWNVWTDPIGLVVVAFVLVAGMLGVDSGINLGLFLTWGLLLWLVATPPRRP